MRSDTRWWDGPWPWLAYLATYGIPWLWVPPDSQQLLLSAVALGGFLIVYFRSFHLNGKALAGSIAIMIAIGVVLVPVGGGWSTLAVYPAMQAARGGSGNLHSGDKWIADLTAAIVAASRRQDEQATAPEPQPGVQSEGGAGCREG